MCIIQERHGCRNIGGSVYIHTANNNITPTKPAPILVTLLFGLAELCELLVVDDDEPVPVLSADPLVPVGLEVAVAYVEP